MCNLKCVAELPGKERKLLKGRENTEELYLGWEAEASIEAHAAWGQMQHWNQGHGDAWEREYWLPREATGPPEAENS